MKVQRRSWRDIAADPEIRAAIQDIDQSLLDWMLSLTPLERLRSVSNATRALNRFKRDQTETGRSRSVNRNPGLGRR